MNQRQMVDLSMNEIKEALRDLVRRMGVAVPPEATVTFNADLISRYGTTLVTASIDVTDADADLPSAGDVRGILSKPA
jgi:hypothetical protein